MPEIPIPEVEPSELSLLELSMSSMASHDTDPEGLILSCLCASPATSTCTRKGYLEGLGLRAPAGAVLGMRSE